ncbi:MAG: hypothetical protein JJ937_11625, partial [Parvibaculum sp.]|nr:hypothetical protein [Parvibaculum sp.]
LSVSGGAPLGALMMGLLVGWLGVFDAVLVPATLMVGILALLYFLTPIWSYRAEAD